MAKALNDNSKLIYNYVLSHDGENFTAADIAEATGLSVASVNGSVTSAFQKREWMERIPAEIELPDGTHKAVKFIKLTEAGKQIDPDNLPEKQ